MTDSDTPDPADSDDDERSGDDVTRSVGTGYKVLGENDATAGTPVGVEGRVPNADGYGLATPDDARIDGELTLAALTGGIAGGDRLVDLAGSGLSISGGELTATAASGPTTLPPYDTIGDDPGAVTDAVASVFSETAWAEPSYVQGPAHREGADAFFGGVVTPTGDVAFVPLDSDHVGLYDPATNTYESGAPHGEGDNAFAGGALAPTGEVVFPPASGADTVGIYEPGTDTFRSGPSTAGGTFLSAVLGPTGEVVFPPAGGDGYVGLYDPFEGSYNRGPEVDGFLSSATLAPTGEVVFPNFTNDAVGVYDPTTNSYTDVDTAGDGFFLGAVTAPTGDVVMAGTDGYVGLLDPETNTYARGASTGDDDFVDATLAPTGEVVLVPARSDDPVGIYDPATDEYTAGPSHPQSSSSGFVFEGGTLGPNGNVVLVPRGSDQVGILNTNAQPARPWVTAQHPLVDNY